MKGSFVQGGGSPSRTTLLPECLDDWVDEKVSNPVRAVDVFVVMRWNWASWGSMASPRQRPGLAGISSVADAFQALSMAISNRVQLEPTAGA